jgi:hypothetical protein
MAAGFGIQKCKTIATHHKTASGTEYKLAILAA